LDFGIRKNTVISYFLRLNFFLSFHFGYLFSTKSNGHGKEANATFHLNSSIRKFPYYFSKEIFLEFFYFLHGHITFSFDDYLFPFEAHLSFLSKETVILFRTFASKEGHLFSNLMKFTKEDWKISWGKGTKARKKGKTGPDGS
jgi:hypothetical protein